MEVVLKKFVAYIPFWSKMLTSLRFPGKTHPRPNNGIVEGYIGDLKTSVKENHILLGKFGTVKLGRYIDFQRNRMQSDVKQMTANYSEAKYKRVQKKDNTEIEHDQLAGQSENWRGKSTAKKRGPLFFNNVALSDINKSQQQNMN